MNATMINTTENKKKIFDFACDFANIAKDKKWISRYDLETDSLSYTKPKLSESSRIIYLDNEIALYFNNNEEIEGIFIEYFKSNFIKHHKELKDVLNEIESKKTQDEDTLVELKKMEDNRFLPRFEEIIKSSIADDMVFQS